MTSKRLSPLRNTLGVLVSIVMACGTFVGLDPARGTDLTNPVSGSFSVGGGLSAGIDERTGGLQIALSTLTLPSVYGDSIDLNVSYRHEISGNTSDRFGLGPGINWGTAHVDVSDGIQVFPASGGMYEADDAWPTGLRGYVLDDTHFQQHAGTLVTPHGEEHAFAYTLEYPGGKDFFNSSGDVIARSDLWGNTSWWEWGPEHRLERITDDAGNTARVEWNDNTTRIVFDERSDGIIPTIELILDHGVLSRAVDPSGQAIDVTFNNGLLTQMSSSDGTTTEINYESVSSSTHVSRVRVSDALTGNELAVRYWDAVGEHTASGAPTYNSATDLWASGDENYRYLTRLSDGVSSIVSEYNSLGLGMSKRITVNHAGGDVVVQEQHFVYPDAGQAREPGALPRNYAKPVETRVVHKNATGAFRELVEKTVYDDRGRITTHVGADGATTETLYDTVTPTAPAFPGGVTLPVGFVLSQTTTATDGSVTRLVNTPTPDHRSIAVSEEFTSLSGEEPVRVSRTEQETDSHGFVVEQRDVTENDQTVTTRYDRTIDRAAKTVSTRTTSAAGLPTEVSTSVEEDLVSGLVLSHTDETGRRGTTRYDTTGRVIEDVSETGDVTTTMYGPRVTRVTDPRGITTSEYRDGLDRIVRVTDNIHDDGETLTALPGFERVVESRSYDNNTITVRDSNGLATRTISDAFGRPVIVEGPTGVKHVTMYDDVNATQTVGVLSSTGRSFADAIRTSTHRTDVSGREVSRTEHTRDNPSAQTFETRFDGFGRPITHDSPVFSTQTTYNPDGTPRVLEKTPVPGMAGEKVSAVREFDPTTRVTTHKNMQTTNENRPGVSRSVDVYGRTVTERDQTRGETTITYTPDGLVAQTRESATGRTTTLDYDPVTRELVRSTTILGDTVHATVFEYDNAGRLTRIWDPKDPAGTRIGYDYDVTGNRTRITYPDGKTVRHRYNVDGLVTQTLISQGIPPGTTMTSSGSSRKQHKHNPMTQSSPASHTTTTNSGGSLIFGAGMVSRQHSRSQTPTILPQKPQPRPREARSSTANTATTVEGT